MKTFEATPKRSMPQAAGIYYMQKRNNAARDTSPVDDPTSLAWGTIVFSANPQSTHTVTLGGTIVTFGAGHNVAIGATLVITLANLATFLNASADANVVKCTYAATDTVLSIVRKVPNDATFTLAASNATRSAATLQLVKIRNRSAL